eukprot:CAMPEP_0185254656 /NCGR_PEP_ID=MMETSP1359-20130426/3538_1 /TAXON_ID=552665 /ORGANISM="Bigelowiella longifila, Strain CCMP242" /LENGTH=169 /DNA_ID=CAMNT_0027837903 /DNA_START=129 /DNA_END=638 /DNA_ORIENTATION=+
MVSSIGNGQDCSKGVGGGGSAVTSREEMHQRADIDDHDDQDPNQKKTRGICSLFSLQWAKSVFRSHPIPCIIAMFFVFVVVLASAYLFLEQEYKTITVQKKQAEMKKAWFKSNFKNINKISKEIKSKIEQEHPELAERQKIHDKGMKAINEKLPEVQKSRGGKTKNSEI